MATKTSYANAGHGQRRRQERAKARPVVPLTFVRILAQLEQGFNPCRAFKRHAQRYLERLTTAGEVGEHPQFDLAQHAAFTTLVEYYSSPIPVGERAV